MRFKVFGLSNDDMDRFVQDVADCSPHVSTWAKAMVERKRTAFIPDCTEQSLEGYREILARIKREKIQLYQLLNEEGVFYGGEANSCMFFFSFFFQGSSQTTILEVPFPPKFESLLKVVNFVVSSKPFPKFTHST